MKLLGLFVLLMMVDIAFCMGVLHAMLEIGQYAALYDYEPIWQHSLALAVAYKIVRILL